MNLLENDNGSNLIFIHYFEYHIAETIAFLKINLKAVNPKILEWVTPVVQFTHC